MPKYFENIRTSGTGHYDYEKTKNINQPWGTKFIDFIDFKTKKFKGLIPTNKYYIWQESDGGYSARWLTTDEFNKGIGMFPFFMQGRDFHEGFTPLGFNADWARLVSTFRQSESFGAGDIAGYGPQLPYDYKFSLIDIGLILNFMQCGYVNRYKLPNKARPPLAASRTEQHLMMVNDTAASKWLEGIVGKDPMAGNFIVAHGPDMNLNWANEPHWCGISTEFFNKKGNVRLGGGPISVKSYEIDTLWKSDPGLTGNPLPLNRPRLEEGENDPWDESRWYALKGKLGSSVRSIWYEARDKFGAEKCQHPYDDDYINANKGRINQIWFIPGVHYTRGGKPTKLTPIGADLIKTAILKLDWGGAIITHTGHVETVLALDVDGTCYRYGGNTSVGGKGGNVGNAMGIWGTFVGDFPDSEAGEERGGFCVITRSFPENPLNRSGLGISAPWKITPVVQTYFDFLVKNPNAQEFGVYNDYGVVINKMNTKVNSSFLK